MNTKKILLIQHLNFLNGSGGTEKICSFLANGFTHHNFEVSIATNQNISGKPMFYIDKNVKIYNIYSDSVKQESYKELYNYDGYNPLKWLYYKIKKKQNKSFNRKLRKRFKNEEELYKYNLHQRANAWSSFIKELNPDYIITMSIGSLVEISYKNEYNIPIINSVNGRPDYDYTDLLWYRSPVEMNLLVNSYKKIDKIQVLFDSYHEYLPKTFAGKVETIPNPVAQFQSNDIVNYDIEKEKYTIINVASLNNSCKQQNVAITIFAKLADKYPNWNMVFWGVGNDLEQLEQQIEDLNLTERVHLKGFTQNPIEELKKSDIFIFPSKYEGFPLALTEAMSVGLASIGFKTCSGVNELLVHNTNGFLAQDENQMLDCLEELIVDVNLRKRIGLEAHKSMKQYDEKQVLEKWLELIKK